MATTGALASGVNVNGRSVGDGASAEIMIADACTTATELLGPP